MNNETGNTQSPASVKESEEDDVSPDLPPAALRALKEAAERRRAKSDDMLPTEKDGPKGAEPTRYGDWERNGRAVDF